MGRQQRVLQHLAKCCADQQRGFDARELAGLLGVARHNVSADLNQLWRDGAVVKLPGRPVLFWEREVYRRLHRGPAAAGPAAPPGPLHGAGPEADGPFANMIGAQDSLRSQVEQVKAAVLYPPAGLHTLLVGATGVGKSHLAELMHAFGISCGRLPPAAPFITLNCADYANNAQLLMAHLFGAARGAYTGADREQQGLVDHADGGILFLDEVHRLPPEGQEMLFRLIDKGLYRRLGETGAERRAQVMLIAATTERADSVLLRTFARRIPMVVALPPLAERTPGERFRFVRRFLRLEAGKIGLDIVVPHDTLRMLLEYDCLGNIGQLRTDIQLACARLFLSYLTQNREPMELVPAHLPEHIFRALPPARQRSREVADLISSLGQRLAIAQRAPDGDGDTAGPLSFYGLIEQQMSELQRAGMASAEAEQVVQRNIAGHFRDFVDGVRRQHQRQRQELLKIMGPDILRGVERGLLWAEERLGRALPERILYALALHIHASLEQVQRGRTPEYHLPPPAADAPEATVAAGLIDLIQRELRCRLPAGDVAFAAMLLRQDMEPPALEQVGVVVVAHGRVASAMAEVARALAGADLACALDLALDEDPSRVEQQLVAMAEQGQFPGGLLLLADMGSLETMGEAVSQETGVRVRTVGMVSTPLVLEAVHQASIPGATLDQVYQAVQTARASMLGRDATEGLPQVVVAFCFTGAGSAHTLARMVREALAQQAHRIEVIPASIGAGAGFSRLVTTLLRSHRLLAAVGPVHPQIPGIPYISTEEMVVGQGAQRLRRLLGAGTGPADSAGGAPAGTDEASIFVRMAASLGDHLKVTNPAATVPVVLKALHAVEQYLGRPLDDELRVGLAMHLVCLLERKVRDRLVREPVRPASPPPHRGNLPWLPEALRELTAMFHVALSAEDLVRLDDVISGSVVNT